LNRRQPGPEQAAGWQDVQQLLFVVARTRRRALQSGQDRRHGLKVPILPPQDLTGKLQLLEM
jgi:hypothetical protein